MIRQSYFSTILSVLEIYIKYIKTSHLLKETPKYAKTSFYTGKEESKPIVCQSNAIELIESIESIKKKMSKFDYHTIVEFNRKPIE